MKYRNSLTENFAKILNKNTNSVKIAIKTYNNLINNKISFTKSSHIYIYEYSGDYKLICICNKFYIERTSRKLK